MQLRGQSDKLPSFACALRRACPWSPREVVELHRSVLRRFVLCHERGPKPFNSRTCQTDREAVSQQSPGSRSAPREGRAQNALEPQRGSTRWHVQPLRGWCGGCACDPGVRCATPGFVVGLLRSQPHNAHQPQRGLLSQPRVAKRTLGKLNHAITEPFYYKRYPL
jgi:hypothetical protein